MLQRFRRHLGLGMSAATTTFFTGGAAGSIGGGGLRARHNCIRSFPQEWRSWRPVRRRLGLGVRREGSVYRGGERVTLVLLPIAATTTTTTTTTTRESSLLCSCRRARRCRCRGAQSGCA